MALQINWRSRKLVFNRTQLGAQLAIFMFVFAQFVEVELGSVGGVSLSLQKLLAAFFYPIALVWIRRLRIKPSLLMFALPLWLSFVVALLFNNKNEALLSASLITLVGFLGAFVLYNALSVDFIAGMQFLASWWIKFSLFSSLIAVLQMVGWFPLLTVPDKLESLRDVSTGYFRGVGFKLDPNFLALMLALAVSFILYYVPRGRRQIGYILIVLAGILATFSRMGLLLVALQLAILLLVNLRKKSSLQIGLGIVVMLLVLGIILLLSPAALREYVVTRAVDAVSFFHVLFTGGVPSGWISSAMARAVLLRAAFQAALEYWPIGVGALQTQDAIGALSGLANVSHNTFVELFLIGGLSGLVTVLIYFFIIISKNLSLMKIKTIEVQCTLSISWTMVFAGIFLSLVYNSLLWFSLVLLLAAHTARLVLKSTS